MRINDKLMAVLVFSLFVSICTGSFFEVYMTGAGKQQLEDILYGLLNSDTGSNIGTGATLSFAGCFMRIFIKNLIVIILAYISPAVFITLPVMPAFILLKGISLGFSAAMTLEVAGIQGILYIITTLMPQNLIQFPVYCFLAALSLQESKVRINQGSNGKRKALQLDARRYSLLFMTGLGIITLSCLLEALLVTSV